MSLKKSFSAWQKRRLQHRAEIYDEYVTSINSLYNKNAKGCLFSMAKTKITLQNKGNLLNLVGSGIIVTLLFSLVSCAVLLFFKLLENDISQALQHSIEGLLMFCLFAAVVLIFVYMFENQSYKADRIKFEIQSKTLEKLETTDRK